MAKAGRKPGGPKTGGGSRKGIPNRASKDVRALAQKWGPDALLALAVMAGIEPPIKRLPGVKLATNETVQRAANADVLDRAYGKPSQPMEHTVDETFEAILDRLGR